MVIDERLRDFASLRQRQIIDAVNVAGTVTGGAKAIGVTRATAQSAIRRATLTAARAGYAPAHDMTHPVAPGFHARGVSTMYKADGTRGVQWVKSNVNREYEHEVLVEAMQRLAETFEARAKPVRAAKAHDRDLLAVYPMGDPHFGLLSWPAETGAVFDLSIAERTLVDAVDQLVDLAPRCEQALIVNLGDFFHTDSSANRTTRSGNPLDVDSRWAKILDVGIRAMRRCIDRALIKHRRVRVINEIGNHDDHSAVMLSIVLANYYSNEPRVEIDTSPALHHWHRFGANLIGVTHGDKAKPQDLPGIMACDRAKDWGETSFRYWYCGHVHHDRVKEYPGCLVESFRTLAAPDAWHVGQGYRSGRDMKCDVLHRTHGRILRHTVGIAQLIN